MTIIFFNFLCFLFYFWDGIDGGEGSSVMADYCVFVEFCDGCEMGKRRWQFLGCFYDDCHGHGYRVYDRRWS